MTPFAPLGADKQVVSYTANVHAGALPGATFDAQAVTSGAAPAVAANGPISTALGQLDAGAGQLLDGLNLVGAGEGQLTRRARPPAYPVRSSSSVASTSSMRAPGALSSGAGQLAGGSTKLAAGATTLANKSKALGPGTKALSSGATKLATGAKAVTTGAKTLAAGTATAATGGAALATGSASLAGGATQINSGAQQLATGNASLVAGLQQLSAGLGQLADPSAGLPAAAAGLAQLRAGLDHPVGAAAPPTSAVCSRPAIRPGRACPGRGGLSHPAGALGATDPVASSRVWRPSRPASTATPRRYSPGSTTPAASPRPGCSRRCRPPSRPSTARHPHRSPTALPAPISRVPSAASQDQVGRSHRSGDRRCRCPDAPRRGRPVAGPGSTTRSARAGASDPGGLTQGAGALVTAVQSQVLPGVDQLIAGTTAAIAGVTQLQGGRHLRCRRRQPALHRATALAAGTSTLVSGSSQLASGRQPALQRPRPAQVRHQPALQRHQAALHRLHRTGLGCQETGDRSQRAGPRHQGARQGCQPGRCRSEAACTGCCPAEGRARQGRLGRRRLPAQTQTAVDGVTALQAGTSKLETGALQLHEGLDTLTGKLPTTIAYTGPSETSGVVWAAAHTTGSFDNAALHVSLAPQAAQGDSTRVLELLGLLGVGAALGSFGTRQLIVARRTQKESM